MIKQALNVSQRLCGHEHPGTLDLISCLALVYSGQMRWKEAEALVVQTLDVRNRVLDGEHSDTLTSMKISERYTGLATDGRRKERSDGKWWRSGGKCSEMNIWILCGAPKALHGHTISKTD